MSYQSNSEEQLEELKSFLQKYGKLMLLVLVIGLAAIWGWRYWQSQQAVQMSQASEQYEKLVNDLTQNKPEAVDKLVAFAKQSDNIYGVFSALKAVQYYVEQKQDYTTAQQLLQDAASKAKDEKMQAMINVRIARLQYQQAQYDAGLQTLAKIDDPAWAVVVNDVRGDVLTKLKRYPQALQAYQDALAANPTDSQRNSINMKLNELQYLSKQSTTSVVQAVKEDIAQPKKSAAKETTDAASEVPQQ